MNVAAWLNAGWKPTSNNICCFSVKNDTIYEISGVYKYYMDIPFKDLDTLEKAREILGDDVIKTALSLDWYV